MKIQKSKKRKSHLQSRHSETGTASITGEVPFSMLLFNIIRNHTIPAILCPVFISMTSYEFSHVSISLAKYIL